jgi:hypothetical protein
VRFAHLEVGGCRAGEGDEQNALVVGVEHGAHMEVAVAHWPVVDHQPAHVAVVVDVHEPSGRSPPGRPVDPLDPGGVELLEDRGRRAVLDVDGERDCRPLIAGHQADQRSASLFPSDVNDVWQRLAVPLDVDRAAVEIDDRQADVCVRGAGRGVPDRPRLGRRVARVGDPPQLNGRLVDPRRDQLIARRRPPVAARASELLGGDEVGEAEAHVVGVGRRQAPIGRAVGADDAELAAADVRDQPAVGRQTRVDHRRRRLDLGCLSGPQVCAEQATGQRERRSRHRAVGRVGDDARRRLAAPLAAGSLLGREVLVALGEQRRRVDDLALGAAAVGDVKRPQVQPRVRARRRPQENHPRSVGSHAERPRVAEREMLRPRVQQRKGIVDGHASGNHRHLAESLVANSHGVCTV